jgi:hypothetical protein
VGATTFAGRFVDLSPGGACVEVATPLVRGDELRLIVDSSIPIEAGIGRTVTGTVAWVAARGGEGAALRYRVGITLAPTSVTRHWVSALLATVSHAAVRPATSALATTPAGREILYQRALAALAARDLERARSIVRAALLGLPHARLLRGLLMRVEAEIALEVDDHALARARVEQGRRLAPEEPCWTALEGRAAPTRLHRRIVRLFAPG